MNLKLLFFCLFLAVLLIPAELKNKKDDKHDPAHHDHGHRAHGHRAHGHRDHGNREQERSGLRAKPRKGKERFKDITEDYYFKIVENTPAADDDDDDDDHSVLDWLFELQEPEAQCNPNPCLHNGVCQQKGKKKIKCECPSPYKGKRCEKGPKHCPKGRCGRGECVLTSTPPFYQCKCKAPFQPPDCKRFSVCQPNPCRNGGKCIKDGNDFDCQCPSGYRGHFCQVGPNDCYVDDGESYRGNVSETDDGDECLFWNSHFILAKGTDPFTSFEDKDGLGHHNFCRNPDGDKIPWCFFRKGHRLLWDYCDVRKCPEPTRVLPTIPEPTSDSYQPTKPEPTAKPTAKPTAEPTAKPTAKPTAEPTAKPTAKPTDEPTVEPTTKLTAKPTAEPTADPKPTTIKPVLTTKPTTTEEPTQSSQPSPAPTHGAAPPQFSTCGKPQPKKPITRIFGGLKVAPGAIPWQVSVQVRPKNTNQLFRHVCGGVLIASCWVLTAGHCIEQRKDMQVVLGDLSLNKNDTTEQTIRVEEAIVHENYQETPEAVHNDIGLLRLTGTHGICAHETQFVKTACLPDTQLPDGMECTISGWGSTEQSDYGSNHLLEANVLLINQEKCSEPLIYGRFLDESMFCAGHLQGGVDSCQGDSGGPLTCKQNSTHVIYGLVSWGDQCGKKNKPGVYTRITHFLNWIRSKTGAAAP